MNMDTVAEEVQEIHRQINDKTYGIGISFPEYVLETIKWAKERNAVEIEE